MLGDYQNLTDSLVRDDTGKILGSDRDEAIGLAVLRYSQDRPRQKVEDVAGAGSQVLALPLGWEADFSQLASIEYPIGRIPPELLTFQLYRGPTVEQILLESAVPAGSNARLNYSIKHVLDAVTDTIPAHVREAVASWAAALLCDQLAAFFSGSSDSTIQADSVAHQSKSSEFAQRASTLRKQYYDRLGIDPKKNVAAGVVIDWDLPDSRGADRLLRPKQYR